MPNTPEHIDIEHPAHFRFFAFLNRGEVADARVVHEHVNAAKFFLGGFDGCINLALIRDIQFKDQSLALVR